MLNCAVVYCYDNKIRNKNKTFSLSKDTATAKIWIAKLNREG